jgi:hypothetical protein
MFFQPAIKHLRPELASGYCGLKIVSREWQPARKNKAARPIATGRAVRGRKSRKGRVNASAEQIRTNPWQQKLPLQQHQNRPAIRGQRWRDGSGAPDKRLVADPCDAEFGSYGSAGT